MTMKNEKDPLISVIIPIYNAEKYIEECIESVLQQSYINIEIILIDDGSVDRSGEICDYYQNKYENIIVQHNRNQGPAASRRNGIKIAQGDLVFFLDADDWLEKETLSTLYGQMKLRNADVVTCAYVDVYNNGKRVEKQPFQEEIIECDSFEKSVYQIHATRYLQTGPVAKLYKKELFENVDFREHITIGEDYTMLLQVLKNASKICMLKTILYNRRIYGGNISRSGFTQRHKLALDNYLAVREGLIAKYPQCKIEIMGYHIEYEMAVITAMCRNKRFDYEVISKLRNDLKIHMKEILLQCKIPIYMRVCAVMIAYMPTIFCACFVLLNKCTGR